MAWQWHNFAEKPRKMSAEIFTSFCTGFKGQPFIMQFTLIFDKWYLTFSETVRRELPNLFSRVNNPHHFGQPPILLLRMEANKGQEGCQKEALYKIGQRP